MSASTRYDRTTVSGPPGESSFLLNNLPTAGCTPSIGSTPSVTSRPRTSSGSPTPVTLNVSGVHSPTSWKLVPVLAISEVQEGCGPGVLDVHAGRPVIDVDQLVGVVKR